jgi:DNA-binding IclR family transcriptional regulator
MAKDYTVPAIRRAVQVLEILGNSHTGLSLAELSRQTNIPKSSLFRILLTLEHNSVVLQDHSRDVYTLGMKLIDWGNRALDKIDLKTVSHPHLVRMAHETKESYYLATLDSSEVIIIDRADTAEIWQMVVRLGQRSPVHATASGQVLIAELAPEVLDKIIARSGLKKFTPWTITSVARLKKHLREVKQQGYAVALAEYKPDLCVIAVPVRDHHGRAVAALMTAMQSERARREKVLVKNIVALLKKEAAVISREIGYMDPAEPVAGGANGRK